MQALILAAGFGTRLYPLTKEIPKALIKIKEKPLIEYIIKNLEKIKEIETIYILSNNKFYINFLEWLDDFKKNKKENNNIKKIKILNNGINNEDETKGAVSDFKKTLEIISEDDLFLLASDNLFDFNLQTLVDLSKEKNSSVVALKIIQDRELIRKYNHILLDKENKIIFFEEKPQKTRSNIFSTAIYFLKKQDIEKIKKHDFGNSDNLGEIINFLYKESNVYGKIFDEFWIDIGSFEELEKAKKNFN